MKKNFTKSVSLAGLALALVLSSCGDGQATPKTTGPKPVSATPETDPKPDETEAAALPAELLAAIARAKKEKKFLIAQLHDHTCNFCDEMDLELAKDAVKKKLAEFLFVSLDWRKIPRTRDFIEQHLFTMTPSYAGYGPDGKVIDYSLEGFIPAEVFIVELENFKLEYAGKEILDPPDCDHPSYGKG